MRRATVTSCLAAAVVAAACWSGPAAREPPPPGAGSRPAAADGEELFRKARLLGSDRWRRVSFEFDAWLREQPVLAPAQARGLRADLDRRVAAMSSYEFEYLLDTLEAKLRVLDSPAARDARAWLGSYLAVMAERKRAEVLAEMPNVLDLTTAELVAGLGRLEERRAAVEAARRATVRGREEFAVFLGEQRRADAAARAARGRIRIGDAAFSPYRPRPVADPPFADAAAGPPFPGVGPWSLFGGLQPGSF
jgi:hypothetical protein